jgi:hypothetical protein
LERQYLKIRFFKHKENESEEWLVRKMRGILPEKETRIKEKEKLPTDKMKNKNTSFSKPVKNQSTFLKMEMSRTARPKQIEGIGKRNLSQYKSEQCNCKGRVAQSK